MQVELKTIHGTSVWVILAWPICTESAEDPILMRRRPLALHPLHCIYKLALHPLSHSIPCRTASLSLASLSLASLDTLAGL